MRADVVQVSVALDAAIARIAARQYGVISLAQLIAVGLTDSAVRRRVAAGKLHRLHRGVYLVGHSVPPPLALEQGALLACGDDSFLSHRTVGAMNGVLEYDGPVEVTTRRHRGRPRGITVHTSRRLARRATPRAGTGCA